MKKFKYLSVMSGQQLLEKVELAVEWEELRVIGNREMIVSFPLFTSYGELS